MNWNEVEYYLISDSIGRVKLKFEPINWNDDEKQIVRNTESWGVFTELSNDLQFVKDGASLLERIYEEQGTEAVVTLERYVIEDIQQGFTLDYTGNLDMKTYVKDNERVSVQFLTGGLQTLIESQFDEPYELERDTDINGNDISELVYDRIEWAGRRIFLESLLNTTDEQNNIQKDSFTVFCDKTSDVIVSRNIKMRNVFESENLEINPPFNEKRFNLTKFNNTYNFYRTISVDNADIGRPESTAFFIIRDVEERLDRFSVKVNCNFKYSYVDSDFVGDINDFEFVLSLSKYEFINGEWRFDGSNPLGRKNIGASFGSIEFVEQISNTLLLENRAMALTPYVFPKDGTSGDFASINLFDIEAQIKLEQNSEFAPSTFDGIRLYDAFERMLEIYTGQKERFASNYFSLGQFKDVLLSSGRQIREVEGQRLSVELKDLFETNNYFNLGWSVEKRNGKEVFVVEDKSYFFADLPLFDLGEVSNLRISSAEEFLYKSLTFGNKKAGDYEEVQGLQEYNAETTYQTHLKTADNKYDVEAKIRADLVGAELARRKNITVAPNEDTRYDNENFLFDCKLISESRSGRTGDTYTPKVWQDQLAEAPICYDPPTAGNLLLTPFRSLQRHAKTFGAGLTKYQDKFTRFSSGTGALDVATRLQDKPLRYENGNIINSELDRALYLAEYYEFERPLDIALRKKLRGKTLYNEKEIPNTNFLVKFTYRKKDYFGYIVEVGFNDPGTWKLIRKNDINGLD